MHRRVRKDNGSVLETTVSHSMMKILARNQNTNKLLVLNTFHNFYKLFVLRWGSQMKYSWIYSPHKTGLYNKIRKERPSKENELFINTLRDLFPVHEAAWKFPWKTIFRFLAQRSWETISSNFWVPRNFMGTHHLSDSNFSKSYFFSWPWKP